MTRISGGAYLLLDYARDIALIIENEGIPLKLYLRRIPPISRAEISRVG
mgnify:CR=1 FL=1